LFFGLTIAPSRFILIIRSTHPGVLGLLGKGFFMKYFIDFEASQFAEEIISVGCVDEDGRSFYSLVRPRKPRKVTDFITKLTGITRDEILNAPTADEVFTSFFEWLGKEGIQQFLCYGDCDRHFALNTIGGVTDFRAQLALSLIIANLSDFSVDLRKHFKMKRSIGLAKAVSYYRGEEVQQRHNSLDDARYLREIFFASATEIIDECPFDEEIKPAVAVRHTGKRSVCASRDNFEKTFASCGKAADWIAETQLKRKLTIKEKQSISNKISLAIEREKPYNGYTWTRGSAE